MFLKQFIFSLCLVLLLRQPLIEQVNSSAIRPFRLFQQSLNAQLQYGNCSNETAFATSGCPCALVGQQCYTYGTVCLGPIPSTLRGNYANGNIKVGKCGCGANFVTLTAGNRCLGVFTINATAGQVTPVVVAGCLGAYSAIPGLNMTSISGTRPIQFLLAVVDSSNGDLTPYIGIDATTLEVYLEPFAPATPTNQTYSVLGIDANNQTSNPLIFDVAFLAAPVDIATCPVC